MATGPDLQEFLHAARSQGATDEMLMAVLRGRGWPEEDVYRVLADYFESGSGLRVPPYKRSGSAKDAFLYLLAFSTLATWTVALGSAMFTLIERWLVDPLAPRNYYHNSYYEMAGALAALIIAFPVYLWVTRYIVRELEIHPEKLESAVRKWLTYIALLIAAAVVIGDLITFVTYFLRGELTARFVAKVSTVLLIAGGVFWYYFGSLRKAESMRAPAAAPPAGTQP
jgi:branched-subunit amino acid transport protein